MTIIACLICAIVFYSLMNKDNEIHSSKTKKVNRVFRKIKKELKHKNIRRK